MNRIAVKEKKKGKYVQKVKGFTAPSDPVGNFLEKMHPPEGSPLDEYKKKPLLEKICLNNRSRGISYYDGPLTKEQIIYAYCKALAERSDIIPIPQMTPVYLSASKWLKIARSSDGYYGFARPDTLEYFYLPSFKYKDGFPEFKVRDSYYTVPLSLKPTEGLRLDVLPLYQRDVSMYYIMKQARIKDDYEKLKKCAVYYPLGYDDHSKDDMLNEFIKLFAKRKKWSKLTDAPLCADMIMNSYGQHRFIMENKNRHRIISVLVWAEFNGFIYIYFVRGSSTRVVDDKFAESHTENTILNPRTVMYYEFMKRFPKGTYFVGEMPGYSKHISWTAVTAQPVHIFDIRTYKDVLTKKDMYKNELIPVGKLPYEFTLGRTNPKWKVSEGNKVLYNRQARRLAKLQFTPEAWAVLAAKRSASKWYYAGLEKVYKELCEQKNKMDLKNTENML